MPVNGEKSQLTADVARALRELVDMGEQLRQACAHACGMHPTDFKALGMIQRAKDEGVAMTAGELAARLELSSGAVTYLVERLASAGYVERDSDPQDRRKVLLRATEAGYQLAANARHANQRVIAEVLDEMSPQECATALQAMQLFHQRLSSRTEAVREQAEHR